MLCEMDQVNREKLDKRPPHHIDTGTAGWCFYCGNLVLGMGTVYECEAKSWRDIGIGVGGVDGFLILFGCVFL